MEFGTIQREIYVEAAPEVVFEVVSSPEHVTEWWPDEARYEAVPGSTGEIVFGERDAGGTVMGFTVVDARPPRTFSFRWTHPAGDTAVEGNSLLVTAPPEGWNRHQDHPMPHRPIPRKPHKPRHPPTPISSWRPPRPSRMLSDVAKRR